MIAMSGLALRQLKPAELDEIRTRSDITLLLLLTVPVPGHPPRLVHI